MNEREEQHPTSGLTKAQNRWAMLQGFYYALGGLWPLISLASFEQVTGNKRDEWLVRTVAGILVVVAVVLLRDALWRKHVSSSLRMVAGGVALVMGLVAISSGLSGRISWLYVPDGLIHLAFAFGWLALVPPVWRRIQMIGK